MLVNHQFQFCITIFIKPSQLICFTNVLQQQSLLFHFQVFTLFIIIYQLIHVMNHML